ncbi:sodium-type flagellar protein MotY [Vibrio zhanjiangensis]|uniref:Sodium-type flagellar protein MotY n=2 Tax=Vibrio zhanjiangensis TaxID=1046128 RepID=A0ABQ6EX29_9VIBR|nr:sodium-type flagellar protein MotY [Vibrio zhanjiangensis]
MALKKVMNINVKREYLLLIIFYCSSAMANFDWGIPMDEVNWIYKGSRLECSLIFENSSYGKFSFLSEEIGKLTFKISLAGNNNRWKYAQVYSTPEPWSIDNKNKPVGQNTSIKNSYFTFHQNIDVLLDKLTKGSWIAFHLSGKEVSERQWLQLPTVRIQEPLLEFRRCLTQLPKMSYETAQNLTIYFGQGSYAIDGIQKKILADFSTYLKADTSVTQVLIDGYSDNTGSDLSNLNLSRQRANELAHALQSYGIAEDKIQVRSHGVRYPIASNDTPEDQAKNRRVTIRIVRSNEQIVPQQKTKTIKNTEEA